MTCISKNVIIYVYIKESDTSGKREKPEQATILSLSEKEENWVNCNTRCWKSDQYDQ